MSIDTKALLYCKDNSQLTFYLNILFLEKNVEKKEYNGNKNGEVVEMITVREDIAPPGLIDTKLYIMKTTNSFIISIPKINWSTELSNTDSPPDQFDHLLHSLTFHMYEGNCSELAECITTSIGKYENSK